MKIHEYQAKNILKEYAIPIQDGYVITTLDDAEKNADFNNIENAHFLKAIFGLAVWDSIPLVCSTSNFLFSLNFINFKIFPLSISFKVYFSTFDFEFGFVIK